MAAASVLLVAACRRPDSKSRVEEAKAIVRRELPIGVQRHAALTRLGSLHIPYTLLDSTGTLVRALVRNTSQTAIGNGSLQILLHFAPDSTLVRYEFKEMFIAP